MRRGERDADPEHAGVPGGLVGLRPVLGAPLAGRFRRVVGVNLQEAAGREQVGGDVRPVPVIGLQVRAPERRQQHGEVEGKGVVPAVEGLVVDLARLDPLDVRAQDGLDPALTEQRLGPDLAGGQVSLLLEHHPADAEVTQLVLVAQVDHVGEVPQPAGAQLVLDVEGVLERRALAGILPTPTQMFDGIQFQSALGDTTTTSWPLPSSRRRCRAAVCPEIPAPRITTRAMTCPLVSSPQARYRAVLLIYPPGYRYGKLTPGFRRPARAAAAAVPAACRSARGAAAAEAGPCPRPGPAYPGDTLMGISMGRGRSGGRSGQPGVGPALRRC